jgi:hypothetical protein
MYSDVLDEIWNTIYDYINIPVGVTMETTPKCDEQENIYLRESIGKSENNKLKLVKDIIYTMFDNIIDLEYIAKRNEIMVYYDAWEELESSEICDTINKFTGLNVVPWYDYKKRTELKKEPDFYLDTERYEEELNENYSPAGKEITPNKIVIHKSNPKFRDRISNEGLKAIAGECYKIYAGYGEKCIPAIFATNSTNKRAWFDSTYDDDVWTINTELIPNVKWYKDRHFESSKKHIVTFDNIPSEAIELMREGTGRDMIRESKEESQKEMIENVLNNIILPEYDHVICGFEVKVPNERNTLGNNTFKFVSVTVTFIGGHGTKLFPQTQGIKQMYDNILDEIWQVIYNYTNEAVDTYYKTVNDCGKKNIYLKESIRKVLKEETDGVNTLIDDITSRHEMSDELIEKVKDFISQSNCKKIEFANFKMPAMGVALHDGVLINKMALNQRLEYLLFIIFHETAHQYQFKKYGEDLMYECYLGDISVEEAANLMKHTEEVADEFAGKKIKQLQKQGLLDKGFIPPSLYKNAPMSQIIAMVGFYRSQLKQQNITTPDKISEFFYNMVKNNI